MRTTKLFNEFFQSERAGGLILIFCTILSIILANSILQESYQSFFTTKLGNHDIRHWINDGLMTIFFLLIGLELEREIYIGELSNIKDAMLPLFAAIGGMLAPALVYLSMNFGSESQSGAGIPMATDIAFALGILSLLGNKVPTSLKVFLTALAVMDDLGAILIIAFFYSKEIDSAGLIISLGIFGLLLILNRLKVVNLIPYLIGGVVMWYYMLHSGIHATITGILLAFAIPFGSGDEKSPSYILQHQLHVPVAFFILPIFALANTAIPLRGNIHDALAQNYSLGIILGLIVGKPLGIFLFSFAAISLGICKMPYDMRYKSILGAGMLGGIGFTMSIFIALLAFDQESMINHSKLAILIGSAISGTLAYITIQYDLVHKR